MRTRTSTRRRASSTSWDAWRGCGCATGGSRGSASCSRPRRAGTCPCMSAAPETAPAAAALLAWAAGELRAAGVPEPDADAELLVDDALRRLKEDVGRRAVREP